MVDAASSISGASWAPCGVRFDLDELERMNRLRSDSTRLIRRLLPPLPTLRDDQWRFLTDEPPPASGVAPTGAGPLSSVLVVPLD